MAANSRPWAGKVQLLHDRRAEIVQQVRQLRRAQAGGDVDGARGTAHGLGLLDHQDLAAGLGEGGGGDQAVVASADDDGVEAAHAALPVRALPRSRRISRAALAPGAAMTPPPGWLDEPHM